MPCFVIVSSAQRDKTVEAIMCDPGALGYPDRKSDVPVRVTVSEKTLLIDNEPRPRSIISSVGENGTMTLMVDGSTQQLRNRERRVALAKTSALLDQLRDHLLALREECEDFSLVAEGLGQIYNWIAEERERLTASKTEGSDDAEAR
jgi:hypothetical protein